MPPNLGGFFMVRSYYPSECHADYFDFERIEALKPAIEACGISTLSQSPMLGFHKQMDNRIKRSEERRVGKECRSGWSPHQLQKIPPAPPVPAPVAPPEPAPAPVDRVAVDDDLQPRS